MGFGVVLYSSKVSRVFLVLVVLHNSKVFQLFWVHCHAVQKCSKWVLVLVVFYSSEVFRVFLVWCYAYDKVFYCYLEVSLSAPLIAMDI